MSHYKSAAESAAIIRAAYKARGWNSKMISVRCSNFANGSSVDVHIKSPDVDIHAAREIAESEERIHRCEYSGEILSGANRYVHVSYTYQCQEEIARPFLASLETAIKMLESLPENHHAVVCQWSDKQITICREGRHSVGIWGDSRKGVFYTDSVSGLMNGAFIVGCLKREMGGMPEARNGKGKQMTCGICNGILYILGSLGKLTWLRCRNCGAECSVLTSDFEDLLVDLD